MQKPVLSALALLVLGASYVACSSAPGETAKDGGPPPPPMDAGPTTVVTDEGGTPDAGPATVDQNPTNPTDDGNGALGWAPAPAMDAVQVIPNRDSAMVILPAVNGAVDYRVMTVPAGVSVSADAAGHETVKGSRIFCAGYRQHNLPAAPLELLRQIEVAGLTAGTRLVVEAIDTACPFTGLIGSAHADVDAPRQDVPDADRVPFSVYTEAEIRAAYGSVINNGHGPGATLAAPAAPSSPKVVARTTIKVQPIGTTAAPPVSTFFTDFADETDQPKALPNNNDPYSALFQNSQFTFYAFNQSLIQPVIRDHKMHVILGDLGQDVFGSHLMVPRKLAHLSSTDYLHLTYEIASNASARRYWWISVCGSDQAGQTLAADGSLTSKIYQTPFFMDDDGTNPSLAGWNCFQLFPRNGFPRAIAPGGQPESEIRVMQNKSGNLPHTNVINLSPDQYMDPYVSPSWYRQQDGAGNFTAPMIDEQVVIAPNARFDVFLRRDRVVVYVNGQQRICNDFTSTPLTMAEGAVGFGQVLYHSTAEREEFNTDFWVKTGQRYYLENTPYVDERIWDNVGFDELVKLPSGGVTSFDPSVCYQHK